MEDKHKTEIIGAIGELKGKIDVGFKETLRRHDIANSRTGKLEVRVGGLETTDAGMEVRLGSVEKNTSRINNRAWDIIKYVLIFVIGDTLTFIIK